MIEFIVIVVLLVLLIGIFVRRDSVISTRP
jgi:hypothetical protein